MNIEELSEQLDNLPKGQKKTILAIINHETEVKMEKVLSRLDTIESKFESKFSAIESKFESKFSILLWVISAIGLMIAIFKFIGYN